MKKSWILLVAMVALVSVPVWGRAQKQKHKQKNNAVPMMPVPISEQIDHDIGEMLGAWQVGDVAAMHKYYADDATWVAGNFAPPIAGWQNYVAYYEKTRNGLSGAQLIRKNTDIFHYGNTAWAAYQWTFQGFVQGKPMTARGQTTLIFVKSGGHWLIVHNHTSQICPGA